MTRLITRLGRWIATWLQGWIDRVAAFFAFFDRAPRCASCGVSARGVCLACDEPVCAFHRRMHLLYDCYTGGLIYPLPGVEPVAAAELAAAQDAGATS